MASLTLQDIYKIARGSGLDEEGARAAMAVAQTEGALNGAVGDNGQSFGPFQFYTQGMLPAFAQALGVSVQQAAQVARDQPAVAAQWALGDYLGQAIKDGQRQGLSGAQLATYAQTTGQRSEAPERAGQGYAQLFGTGGQQQMADPIDAQLDQMLSGGTPTVREVDLGDGRKAYYQYDAASGQWVPAPGMTIYGPPSPGQGTPNKTQIIKLNDGSQFLMDMETGNIIRQISGPAPASTAGEAVSTSGSAPFIVTRQPDGSLKQERNPNYVPPREPQAPLGRQLTPAELQLQDLNVQKAQRDLANPFVLAQQQMAEAIGAIQRQIASGEIDPAEGERLIGLSRANIGAALAGTSPWQMEQAKTQQKQFDQTFQQQKAQQQQGLARGLLGDQLSTGSNMAQGLLSGLGGIYGKILGSSAPPTNFNPLDMAKAFTYDMGGGQQMNDLAKNILMGALQGQGG